MTEVGELISNYKEIRRRLLCPPNAVPDRGINLRRNRIPQNEPEFPPLRVLECSKGAPLVACRVLIAEVPAIPLPRKILKMAQIERAVCSHFRISLDALHGRSRRKLIVYPRHICWYLAAKHTLLSLPRIGLRCGDRDHTSVLHARRKIEEMILVDEGTAGIVRHLENVLFGNYDAKGDLSGSPVAAVAEPHLAQQGQEMDGQRQASLPIP